MKPKIKNTIAWEQAELIMQPAFIRVIDNIRKQLEQSLWTGTYQEVQTPVPGYQLHLSYQDRSVDVNIWDLCFQVCFRDYNPALIEIPENGTQISQEVEIDTSLIDETGEVDWQRLETKAQHLVKQIFANLPTD